MKGRWLKRSGKEQSSLLNSHLEDHQLKHLTEESLLQIVLEYVVILSKVLTGLFCLNSLELNSIHLKKEILE